jgi:hypothetical protein
MSDRKLLVIALIDKGITFRPLEGGQFYIGVEIRPIKLVG